MVLPTPHLDDRTFQEIVNQAKGRIAQLCPAWTDHNVSDPGVTLVELFAWMVEMLLYRLNRVPEKSYITFMELMGVKLVAPAPAHTDLTFWLNEAARETPMLTIPAGTEVTTKQTNSAEPAVTFSTDRELKIQRPDILAYLTSTDGGNSFTEHPVGEDRERSAQPTATEGKGILIFGAAPKENLSGFYFVSQCDIGGHILELNLTCVRRTVGVQVEDPPLAWEARCSSGWRELQRKDGDWKDNGTNALNDPGTIILHLPQGMVFHEQQGFTGFWVRCVYRKTGQKGYDVSPLIRPIQINTIGATVSATQAITIGVAPDSTGGGEVLGYSDGSTGQRFQLQYRPVLELGPNEQLQVEEANGGWQIWEQPGQPHFGFSQGKRHFLLDQASGVIRFGPQIREPDGTETQYGEIPPRGRLIRITRYRSGGGAGGNVPPEKISEPKRTLAFVRSVTNRRAAGGGRDGETLERAKLRAPQELHAVTRAVTTQDYEQLALQADPLGRVARARCFAPQRAEDGQTNMVTLMIVPAERDEKGHLIVTKTLKDELKATVKDYLEKRQLLTSKLEIIGPNYREVSILAHIRVHKGAEPKIIRQLAERRLDAFLHPLHGADGSGWSLGRGVYISELYSLLQAIPGVAYIERLKIRDDPDISEGALTIGADELITPADHNIVVR